MTAPRRFAASALPLLLVPALGCAGAALAADREPDAKSLYEQSCVKCHGPEVFTRPDRKIHTYAELAARVRWCESNLELRWFDEDVDAVTKYLNDNFYKLKP